MEDEEDSFDPIPYLVKTFHLGVQLPGTFVAKNNPEKTKWSIPICIEEPVVPNSIPMYDKFLLYPKPGIEISLEELKAYRWFKARSITVPITECYDHILTNTVESGIRLPPGFVSKNIVQTQFKCAAEDITQDDIIGFQVCFKKLYSEDKSELSLEELLVVKHKKGLIKLLKEEDFEDSLDNDMDETLIGNRRQSIYPLNRKSCFAHRKSIVPRKSIMPPPEVYKEVEEYEPLPSRVKFEDNEVDDNKPTGTLRKSILKRKIDEIIWLDDSLGGVSDLKNKFVPDTPPRSSFSPFNQNDTCSTQQFNLFIQPQSISTPISKKSAPKLIPIEQHSPPPSTLSPEKFQITPAPVTPFASQTLQNKQLSTIMETTEITQSTKSSSSSSVEPINSPENDTDVKSQSTASINKTSVGTVLLKQLENDVFLPIIEENNTIPKTFSVFEDESEAMTKLSIAENVLQLPQCAELKTVAAFSVFKDQSEAMVESPVPENVMLPPSMPIFKSPEIFDVNEDQSEAMIESPEAVNALLPPSNVTNKSPEVFSIFEDQSEAMIESPIVMSKSSEAESVMVTPQITIKSPEVFSVFEDQPEATNDAQEVENSMMLPKIPNIAIPEAFSIFEDQSEAENSMMLPKTPTNAMPEAFSVFEDQPEAENSMMLPKIPTIAMPEAFSVFEDQPEAENSMMLPKLPTIAKLEAFSVFEDQPEVMIQNPENENSMIAFNILEDVTETQKSIRELLVMKNAVPILKNSQESAFIVNPLPPVTSVGFSIFEDSLKIDTPKSVQMPLKSEDDKTSSLHMSRKENVPMKTAPTGSAMDSFQIFEDKTETVPIIAFRSIKLVEQLKKRTPSEEFFEIMMKSPDRMTACKNVSIVKNSIQVKTMSTEVKSPLSFEVDEENLNTEKFQFNLNCNKNSTLIHPTEIINSPIASEVKKSHSDSFEDFNLSIALNENEAALLKNLQPAFKIPEIPVKRAEKKKDPIEEKIEEYDEHDDLGKSIYVSKPQPDTHENEEEWLDVDGNASFIATESNQYEHTIITPEASNKVRVLIEADCGNPFNSKTREAMLEQCNFSSYLEEHIKKCTLLKKIPPLKAGNTLCCGDEEFTVQKAIGKGSFGSIFSGKCIRTGKIYAMKQEKPANLWEYYVIVELMSRLVNQNVVPGLMRIDYAVVANNASVLISEFSQYGSLIDVCNKIKTSTNKNIDEYIVMLLTTQILTIIDHLHGCRIIHADIKPDNFILLNKIEYGSKVPVVQLIDFGCAIDMDWYQENETFNYVVETENFTCIEMLENKPWTYQTDLFGLAATTHVMLFGKYMEVQKKMLSWSIKQRMPRYFNKHLWDQFFHLLLNIPGCDLQPNLQELKTTFEEELEFKERYVHDKIQEFNLALSN